MNRRASVRQSRALILIDSSATRKNEAGLYEARCRELERTSLQLKTFENQDSPAFTRWMEREFGTFLDKIRTIVFSTRALEARIESVQAYARHKHIPLRNAYLAIKDAEQNGTLESLWEEISPSKSDGNFAAEEDFESDFFKAFETLFENAGMDSCTRSPQSASEKKSDSYLKSVYRQLARILHPDINSNHSAREKHLWNEAQQAYASKDLPSLQRLLESLSPNGGETLNLDLIPVGDIIQLRRNIESQLRSLKNRLKMAHKEPPWNFCKTAKNKKRLLSLKQQVERSLTWEEEELIEQRRQFEQQIARWEKPLNKKPSKKDRPTSPSNKEPRQHHFF